jgi:hypothetical protein
VRLDRHTLVVVAIGLACSFDPSSSGGGVDIGPHDTETDTTTGSSSPDTSSGEATTAPTTTTPDDTTGGDLSTGSDDDDPTAESAETGMPGPMLVDRGLLARWFLAEAAMGVMPNVTVDAAEEPFDLQIDFSSGLLSWTEAAGQRGITWTISGANGAPIRAVADSKFAMMHGRTNVTIEIVAAVSAVTSNDSRLFHIGTGSNAGDLSVRSNAIEEVELVVNDSDVATWPVNLAAVGRSVFHLVYDSTQPVEDDRARLYLNGTFVLPSSTSPPQANDPILLSDVPYVALGNRDFDSSIQGAVFYAAVYARPLTDDEILHNAGLLFADDDDP